MGALIGLTIQLTIMAIGLIVTATIWMIRITIMLVAGGIALLSSAISRD
jgi:hypothetical protein